MQTPLYNFARLLCLCLAFGQTGPVLGQRPWIGLQFSAGQATLSITGAEGAVYSIQYANDLSTHHWTDRTLVQVQGANALWTDPALPGSNQRFYRAVSVAAPADTNLVFIQPGTFTMGSPSSEASRYSDEMQHVVSISRGFWLEKYLVTQGDYLAVVGSNPSYFQIDPSFPVDTVSWFDASNYCALRTQQERAAGWIATNYLYRLPTEAEWEYAARAGTATAFNLGNELSSGQANFNGLYEYDASMGTIYNTNGVDLSASTPVGSYPPNGWGLYDMIGNLWEWCQDWYGPYPAGVGLDPSGPATGDLRVIRGGGWGSLALLCRSAQRGSLDPSSTYVIIGFRVALAPAQP